MSNTTRALGSSALLVLVMAVVPSEIFAQRGVGISNPQSFVRRYLSNRPTVSPWINLISSDQTFGSVPNYQALVRPMLDQRDTNRRQQQQIQRLQQQTANSTFRNQQRGATGVRQTGHPTRFMNYLHYYQMPLPRR